MSPTFSHMPTKELIESERLKKESEQLMLDVCSYKSSLWGFRYFIDKRYTQYLEDFCEYYSQLPPEKIKLWILGHLKKELSFKHLTGEKRDGVIVEIVYLKSCNDFLKNNCDKYYEKIDTQKKILQFSKYMITEDVTVDLPEDLIHSICSYVM